jgi:hypothetical protein
MIIYVFFFKYIFVKFINLRRNNVSLEGIFKKNKNIEIRKVFFFFFKVVLSFFFLVLTSTL